MSKETDNNQPGKKLLSPFQQKTLSDKSLKPLRLISILVLTICFITTAMADDGYRLWLKYDKIGNSEYLNNVRDKITSFSIAGHSPTIVAAREELKTGLDGLLGRVTQITDSKKLKTGQVLCGTPATLAILKDKKFKQELSFLGKEGYFIQTVKTPSGDCILIGANEDIGVLYGVFHFLRLIQTRQPLSPMNIRGVPRMQLRMLNHWDNLGGSVGRGYAGRSLWKWNDLPGKIDPRYKDYARANASIGINGAALNNVNASPEILNQEYLVKVTALADVFRPYGIRVFLSVNFASPKKLGGLATADPLDSNVIKWWKDKADEIYKLIPDFGGFLVKANVEGQPGPLDYGRSHAQGANMLAEALAPHNGVLIWRAFVYSTKGENDRVKMAYEEFKGLDGRFNDNTFLQVKNGPLDFQPREPFSPLFGAMPETNEMMEFQITQEYLGHSQSLVYLAPLFKETLESDTYAAGKGSTVARILDGSIQHQPLTGIAGVANTGDDANWTGYLFGQANWYAFGRLAWDHELSCEEIADEWIKMTLSHTPEAVKTIQKMMSGSREALVNYEMPLGLTTLTNWNHNGPDPGFRTYYHRADSVGLGFDRTTTGSDAVSQYFPEVRDSFNNIHTCPEELLTWFHHVPWDFRMKSGRTFWEELCYRYDEGVNDVLQMQKDWLSLKGEIDPEIFNHTRELLATQEKDARKWRNVCLDYFQKFSGKPIPGKP